MGSVDAESPSPAEPDVEDTGEAADTDPPEEERPTWTPPDAVWSAEEVAQAFEELLTLGVPDPFTVFDGYRTMFDGADPGCPGGGPYEITSTASGCVSDSGWLYAGMASIHDFEYDIEEATVLNVDGYVISPSGSTFYGGGNVAANLIRDVDADAWLVQMIGTFGLDTSETEWFAMMPSLALTGSGGMMEADRQADLLGGWELGGQAIYLDLTYEGSCEGFVGDAQLRDPSGVWHTLSLDCEQCGPVRYAQADATSEICLDTTPIEAFLSTMEAAL